MRLSLDNSVICKVFGVENGLKIIKNAGFDDVDYIFMAASPKDSIFEKDFRKTMSDTAQLLKKIGLGCNQTHSSIPISTGPVTIHYGDDFDMSNPRFANMVYVLESSAIMGATQCVFHGLAVPQGGESEQYMEFNYNYFKALEPYAKKYGIKIGIENLEKISGNLYKAEWQNELLDRLNSDQFYALVDLGHAAASDTTPDAHLLSIPRGRVQGLHFHDFNTITAHIVPGLGITDWDKVAQVLAEIGYEGDIDMEVSITYRQFPKHLFPTVLQFIADSGKIFIEKFENAKAALKK